MKTKRISAGIYEFSYKGREVKLIRCEDDGHPRLYRVWWNVVIDAVCDEAVNTKRLAIETAMRMIDSRPIFEGATR